jgi:quercetin dioxygenase-like cupin family protein
MTETTNGAATRRMMVAAAMGLGGTLVVSSARAAECPADKAATAVSIDGPRQGKGVTDTVLTALDLGEEKVRLRGYQLRLRRLVVQPGGEVPVHSHENRPALIYIESGEMTEFKNTCAVPIVHRAGQATPEDHRVVHWWRNTGRVPAVILSADVFGAAEDPHMM